MDTFPSLFQQHIKARNSDLALRVKRLGLWNSLTWGEAYTAVENSACGLAFKELRPNETVAIIGNNIPELYLSMLAVQCVGALPVPIHPDSGTKELISFLNNCEAKIAIVQDQQQVDALYNVIDQCTNLSEVIYNNGRGMVEYDHTHLSSFEQLRIDGRAFAADHPGFFEDAMAKVSQESDAFILYTSGTSGQPRGAVHTHDSLINTAKAFAESQKVQQDEEVIAFMPLSYSANSLFTYSLWLLKGFTVFCPESNDTIMNDLRETGPTLLYAPPHFYKQLYSEIIARSQRSKTKSFLRWFKVAREQREKILRGEAQVGHESFNYKLGNILMYAPLKNIYGLSKLRYAYTGGDVLSNEIFNFMRSIGINLVQTYGTAESAGLICVQGEEQVNSISGEHSVGPPLTGVEIKKLDNNEIAFRGINTFKEYYRNPDADAASRISDGWIRTGDTGDIDDKGALSITERVDAIGKFSNGDMFAPHLVESELKSSPYIKEAVVVGDGKDSIAALVTIDADTVGSWAETNNVRFTGYRDLATKDAVYELVQNAVVEVNQHIKTIEGEGCPPIKRFLVMYREFSVEAGEITRSRKVRRDVIMDRHKALIDALYSSQQTFEVKDSSSGETLAELKLKTA